VILILPNKQDRSWIYIPGSGQTNASDPKELLSADEKTSIQSRMLLFDAATGIGPTDPDRARVPLRWAWQ
jgi:hypothetical protein